MNCVFFFRMKLSSVIHSNRKHFKVNADYQRIFTGNCVFFSLISKLMKIRFLVFCDFKMRFFADILIFLEFCWFLEVKKIYEKWLKGTKITKNVWKSFAILVDLGKFVELKKSRKKPHPTFAMLWFYCFRFMN
jgi:hypothetical protein